MSVVSTGLPFAHRKIKEVGNTTMSSLQAGTSEAGAPSGALPAALPGAGRGRPDLAEQAQLRAARLPRSFVPLPGTTPISKLLVIISQSRSCCG